MHSTVSCSSGKNLHRLWIWFSNVDGFAYVLLTYAGDWFF